MQVKTRDVFNRGSATLQVIAVVLRSGVVVKSIPVHSFNDPFIPTLCCFVARIWYKQVFSRFGLFSASTFKGIQPYFKIYFTTKNSKPVNWIEGGFLTNILPNNKFNV